MNFIGRGQELMKERSLDVDCCGPSYKNPNIVKYLGELREYGALREYKCK